MIKAILLLSIVSCLSCVYQRDAFDVESHLTPEQYRIIDTKCWLEEVEMERVVWGDNR